MTDLELVPKGGRLGIIKNEEYERLMRSICEEDEKEGGNDGVKLKKKAGRDAKLDKPNTMFLFFHSGQFSLNHFPHFSGWNY
jgi:hypothetical protein